MKSRSHHRLPLSEPHQNDDWGDGSWTVDCICGVNFDDGEEMVNCDECGVWVHTRCTHYVKSEKSFACDKCKSNKNSTSGGGGVGGGITNDSEETEVAEFLVELPTKTLRMESANPSTATSRRPLRLWTDIPMEERVHVQGVPGGEPGLFSGIKMSPVFGPELWKCAGYVPKKFNFRYREFPFFGEGEADEKNEEDVGKGSREGDVHGVENGGAGLLCSLSKEDKKSLPVPVTDVVVAKSPVRSGGRDEMVSPKQKKWEKDVVSASPEDGLKKKNTSVEPTILRFAKRKKDESGMSKDQCVKKKVRTAEKEGDVKDQAADASKAASTFSSDANQFKFSQGRGFKAVDDDTACGRDIIVECATNLASSEREPEATPRNDLSNNEIPKERNRGDQVPGRSENFSNTNDVVSLTELNGPRSMPVKEKAQRHALQSCVDIGGVTGSVGIDSHDTEPVAVDVTIASPEAKESQNEQQSDEANSRLKTEIKAEVDVNHGDHNAQCLPVNEVKLDTMAVTAEHQESSADLFSEEGKVIETSVVSSEAGDSKANDGRSPVIGGSRNDRSDESPGFTVLSEQEPTASEGSLGAREKASGFRNGSEVSEKLNKLSRTDTGHHTVAYQRKVVVSMGKHSGGVVSKSSNNWIPATAQKPSADSRQKESSERSIGTIRDNTLTGIIKDVENGARPRKIVKEPSKLNSLSKTSQSTKLSDTSDSKRVSSDAKDSTTRSSSKVLSEPHAETTLDPGESVDQPPIEGEPHVGKGEKSHQSGSHVSSRGNAALMTSLPSSTGPATLSDEELALLLHQELNSSPRVPRVPRMRNAGSLPQLTSPTATSMLMKRTYSSGGKDHAVASRKRTKDFTREGSHGSLEADNQPNKQERRNSSPDNRKRDSGSNIDLLSRREADGTSIKAVQHNMVNVGSSVSSSNNANGQKFSSSQSSSRKVSDEDAQAVGRLTNHTLPGLIAEIMSEGKRMTYEELCNAVLPHWPHLRKHNGERYAYTSHSQAVLDCLRNRSEWACLVDRGPKTSASRKRRKHDGESLNIESEDSDDNRVKKAKDVGRKSFDSSHQEDFPKGKQKARKRRRLALQGKTVARRRRRADVVSDDESESFPESSEEESASSEEEILGGGASIVRNEASASSDDSR